MNNVVPINKTTNDQAIEPSNLSPIHTISSIVEDDLARVNHTIIDQMQSSVSMIPQLAGHLIASGGKRIRPLLTLAGANLCNYVGQRHIGLAACVEFIHAATLLHDDVVDESLLRRGQASANTIWGNQASVLVGDFLFSRAFQLMVTDGSLRVLKLLSDASARIAEGEVMQLQTTRTLEVSENQYMEMIAAKTAVLFTAAAKVPAIVSESGEAYENALGEYGTNLGIAFQLSDDILDYDANQTKLGKTIGDDFREGKVTLPVLLAWLRGTTKERIFWKRTIVDDNIQTGDLEHAISLMKKHDAFTDTQARAHYFATVAEDALRIFPPTPMRENLTKLAYYCINRTS